jgi:hypothetical protein
VDIISYSAGTMYGPKDGTGWHARMVDAAVAKGILWVGASGNEADAHLRTVYTDSDQDGQHEFPDGYEVFGFSPYTDYFDILLQWDDWGNADQDYELHLYDSSYNLIASSTDPQEGEAHNEPVEYIYLEGDSLDDVYYIAIEAYDKTWDVTFDIIISPVEMAYYTVEYSLSSPADSVGSLTVGATEWRDDTLAFYSSQGPTTDGRVKPDISAPTTVSGASYGPESFTGTSSSTPHVSGAAALVWQANPGWTREQVRDYLLQNAIDLGPTGPDSAFGYGRLELPDPGEGAAPVEVVPTTPPEPTGEPVGLEIPTLPVELPDLELPELTALPDGLIPTIPVELPTLVIPTIPAELPTIEIPPVDIPVTGIPGSSSSSTLLFLMTCLIGGVACGGMLFIGGIVIYFLQRKRPPRSTPSPLPTMPTPWLEVLGRRYNIPQTGLTIGRERKNQIVLRDSSVSRVHAQIETVGGYLYIRDMGSANGTKVNGQRITQHLLQDGDQILVGQNLIIFHAN